MMMSSKFDQKYFLKKCMLSVPILFLCLTCFGSVNLVYDNHSNIDDIKRKLTVRIHDNNVIIVNGVNTDLSRFSKTIDKVTNNWSKKDFSLYELDIKIYDNVDNEFLDKMALEYKKTKMSNSSDYFIPLPLNTSLSKLPKPIVLPFSSKEEAVKDFSSKGTKLYYNDEVISLSRALKLIRTENISLKILGNETPTEHPKITLEKQ